MIEKVSVMIVDDSEIDRLILHHLLNVIGVSKIIEMDDGASALDYLRDYELNRQKDADKFPPMAIFLDINMPIVNGFDFLDEFNLLREKHDFGDSQVFMYTSSAAYSDKEKSQRFRFVKDYFVKAVTPKDVILQALESLVE